MAAKALSTSQEVQALALLAEGKSQVEVGAIMGCDASTISRVSKKQENAKILADLKIETRKRMVARVRKVGPKLLDHVAQELDKPKLSTQDAIKVDGLMRAAASASKIVDSGDKVEQVAQAGVVIQIAPWALGLPSPQQATVIEVSASDSKSLGPEK